MASDAKLAIAKLDKKFPVDKDNPKSGWRWTCLDLYDQGASDREIMRQLGLTPAVWQVLYEDALDSDFAELVDYGRIMAHAWWESQGRINLKTRGFQTGLWALQMKNRFGWSEKNEQSLTQVDFANKSNDELVAAIKQYHAQFESGVGKG